MKKEAVQDERKRPVNEEEFENPLDEMPVIDILEAEKEYNNNEEVKQILVVINLLELILELDSWCIISKYMKNVIWLTKTALLWGPTSSPIHSSHCKVNLCFL